MRIQIGRWWVALFLFSVAWAQAQTPLPSNVAFKLQEIQRIVDRAEKSFAVGVATEEAKIATAKTAVEAARAGLAEIERRYAGKYPPDHPDVVAMQNRIQALEAQAGGRAAAQAQGQAAAAQQAAAAGAASGDWLARLSPFVVGLGQPGHDEAKYLIPSATQETAEMQKRLGIYGTATAALAEYRRANLGALETDELRQIVAHLDAAIRQFGESCVQYADMDLGEIDAKLAYLEEFVRNQDAKSAAGESTLFFDRNSLEEIQTILDRAGRLAKPDDPRLVAGRDRIAALKTADARLRAARAADTRMRPDAYAGGDAADLKRLAEQIVARAQPGIRILKTAVVSPDWQQESVVEWTDTTQTALRHRTTRSVTAEVAGRLNANTQMYTLDLSQDLLAGGGWSPPTGHVMFSDPMLEENAQ